MKVHRTFKDTFYNLPSGQPYFGERIETALVRIFGQNTGLQLPSQSFSFDSLHLKIVKTTKGEILFDDAFLVFRVKLTHLQKARMRLKNSWVWREKGKLSSLNCWPEVRICIMRQGWKKFLSYEVISDYILR